MQADTLKKRSLLLACAGLGLYLAWQAWSLSGFIAAETRPPAWDEANHLDVALSYREAAGQGRWADIWWFVPKADIPPFPPLHHLALAVFMGEGRHAWSALWANWFYLALLSAAVFGMAWEVRKDSTALAAPLMIVGAPVVQGLLYTQLPDLALTAWAAAGLWALLKTDGFSDRRGSLVFGAVFAAGMLHKWSYFSYLWPAYVLAARALGKPESRRNVLRAAALAFALSAPWYLVRLPLVLSRLVAAASDFAVPFWKGRAFFTYLLEMPASLGPLFAAFALAGAVRPKSWREPSASRLILACVAASYVFWAVVPNRQMRYLLPGLPGLAVLCAAAWDRRLVWLIAGIQLLAAVNFTHGRIPLLRARAGPASLEFFPSEHPTAEDWRIEEILAESAKRWKGQGAASIALVANDARFNELNFIWTLHRLSRRQGTAVPGGGWSGIRITGPGAGLWELSDFVVLKKGFLGPASVTQGLTAAAADFSAEHSWAQRAFTEARRWSLPDGSIAVLFEKARPLRWCEPGELSLGEGFPSGKVEARGLRLRLENWKAREAVYGRVAVEPEQLCWRGVCAAGPRLELTDAGMVSAAAGPAASCGPPARLVRLGGARVVSASVSAEDLKAFLQSRGLETASLDLDDGIRLRGRFRGVPISLDAALLKTVTYAKLPLKKAGKGHERLAERQRLAGVNVQVRRLALAGVPLPAEWMFRYLLNGPPLELSFGLHETVVSTALRPGGPRVLPFSVDLPGVTVAKGRLSVP
ncbi:MAG: hypothetical protein HZB91_12460 [Elusimicrobia bacterium]|nr:hypothetical protein [Elusimicrobiota bacterium]